MLANRFRCVILALGLVMWATAGDGLASGPRLLFEDDFASAAIGGTLAGWSVGGNKGHLQIVADPEAVGGKAVRIAGDVRRATQMAVRLPTQDPLILVEHSLRWVKGFGLNYWLGYAVDGDYGKHNVNWFPDRDGNLAYRYDDNGKTKIEIIGPLDKGWNRVRLLVNLERKEAYMTLNETHQSGPLPLWNVADAWNEIRLTFYDTGRWSDRSAVSETESYYDDVRIWTVAAEDVAAFCQGQAVVQSASPSSTDYSPIWIEYGEVARQPPEWGHEEENRALADRIVHMMESGRFHIDIPVQLLTVPDGILSTQLMVLARVYAATGEARLKQAFVLGVNTLLEAQFPSGLWPTVFPDDRDQDLIKDKFAKASWDSIPALFRAIIDKHPPFDTDIVEGIDPTKLEEAIARIPAQDLIRDFSFLDYAAKSEAWWASQEAVRIGDNLLSWQTPHGGWERVIGMAAIPFSPEKGHIWRGSPFSDGIERGDFLKGRTTEPLRFLARLYEATGEARFLTAFYRGLDFVLDAQYPSGGWPRHYPRVGSDPTATPFSNAVTFYYDAMVMTLEFIRDIALREFPFGFVNDSYRPRLKLAFEKGIEFILAAQIEVDGRLTAWAQRHSPFAHEPVAGRAFEPVAINPWVSVGIVELLQSLPDPSAEVRHAILSALEWLEEVRLEDGRWAMFYEIDSGRPIFAGRDSVIRYELSEIELERQLGYAWYGTWPEQLLKRAYREGYFDTLYKSLPDYPAVRVRFPSLENGSRVSGTLPLNIELMHPHQAANLTSVTVDVDGELLYRGDRLPDRDELHIDTEKLDDGHRLLTVTTVHHTYGTFRQALDIRVANRWTLVQNMAPPVTEGWFPLDFLQTASRSEGWVYDTSDSDHFFRDPHRLVRGADTSGYLIWETPRLQTMTLTLFVRPDVRLEDGLELAVAISPEAWQPIAYAVELDGEADNWQRAMITLDFSGATDYHWFRLALSDALPKDGVQIGGVVFAGFGLH